MQRCLETHTRVQGWRVQGARLSLKHGAPLVQALLIVVVVASAADLLGVFRLLAQLVALL